MQAVPMALMAAGSIVKGVSAYKAGVYNHGVADQNSKQDLLEGNEQAIRIRDAARLAMGRQFGAQAESGFMVNQGSALTNLVDSATNSEMDALDALHTAQSRAAAVKAQGLAAYREGKSAMFGSLLSGAAQAVGAYNDYAAAGSQYGGGGIPSLQSTDASAANYIPAFGSGG